VVFNLESKGAMWSIINYKMLFIFHGFRFSSVHNQTKKMNFEKCKKLYYISHEGVNLYIYHVLKATHNIPNTKTQKVITYNNIPKHHRECHKVVVVYNEITMQIHDQGRAEEPRESRYTMQQ